MAKEGSSVVKKPFWKRAIKRGDIYTAYGHTYNWEAAPGTWTAGVDYRAPTCAACHMSGSGPVLTSHDVTERLAWETQAPLTVRPEDFKPFPAKVNHEVERQKMKDVCLQCHSDTWTDSHFVRLDKVVEEYNEVYFKPAQKVLDDLYARGLLDKTKFFDEELEFEFYELWHHEGRRARFGAAMMAPDYTWWHGFYEYNKTQRVISSAVNISFADIIAKKPCSQDRLQGFLG
jgi:hydroxylamine dehydrogenase